MRRARFLKGSFLLMTVAGLALAGPASADEKHSGNTKVPSYFVYPRGSNLAQSYARPAAGISSLAGLGFNASPGAISPSASMSAIYQHPATRKLAERQCLLLSRSSVQIHLGAAAAGLVGGPQVLHKFSYGMQYKDIPLSKHTSQGLVISSRGNQRKVLFSRDRNLPDPDKLPADTKATVEQEAATRIGLNDAKQAVGEINVEVAAGEANERLTSRSSSTIRVKPSWRGPTWSGPRIARTVSPGSTGSPRRVMPASC